MHDQITPTRLPPYSQDAEVAYLGALLVQPAKAGEWLKLVTREAFYLTDHQIIYDVLTKMHADGIPADVVTLKDELEKRGLLDEIGGVAYMATILGSVPVSENADQYARIINDKHHLRLIIQAADNLTTLAHRPHIESDTIMQEAVKVFAPVAVAATPKGDDAIGLDQIINRSPELRRPIIHGMLRHGEIGAIVAAPKSMKSWLATDLALSVANGIHWLGTPTERAPVLYVDNELHEETFAYRARSIVDYKLSLGEPIDTSQVRLKSVRGQNVDLVDVGEQIIRRHKGQFGLVILDALYRFYGKGFDENDNASMTRLYNHLDYIATNAGCSILLVHHTSKGNQSEKNVTDVGAGAGSQSRAADSYIVLRQHEEEGCSVMDGVVRSFKPFAPIGMRFVFPCWQRADIDVTLLKKQNGNKAEDKQEIGIEQFAREVVGPTARRQKLVYAMGEDVGLSKRQIEHFIERGLDRGIIAEEPIAGDARQKAYRCII